MNLRTWHEFRRHSQVRLLRLVAVVGVGVICLSGCADMGRGMIISAVNSELKPHETAASAIVDLDALIPGDWTQLTIACTSVTRSGLENALGFRWDGASIVERREFFAMIVFSTKTAVESYLSVGQNDFFEDWYFSPCPGGPEWATVVSSPIVIPRESSQIEFAPGLLSTMT